MRLAPVPMYFAGDAAEAIAMAADSSRTTHQAREAVDACRYFAGLLIGALRGVDKETLLSRGYCPVQGLWARDPPAEKIASVAGGSFKDRNPPDIRGTGYVVEALEAALWAFHRSDDFSEGALLAVNLGDDADTTGAIYGQIAGAHCRRPLRSGADPGRLARQADDGGGDHVASRPAARCSVTSRFRQLARRHHGSGRCCSRSGIALWSRWRSARSGLIQCSSSSDCSHTSPRATTVFEPGIWMPLRIGSWCAARLRSRWNSAAR